MHEESILTTIKQLVGIDEACKDFDTDIIIHINNVFSTLLDLGVKTKEDFFITDEDAVWTDFLDDVSLINRIISYTYLKVKLAFDPPQSSSVAKSMENMANQAEWRINVAVDPGKGEAQND